MALRLSGQTSIFGVVSFVSKSLMGIEGQKKLEKFAILTRKPRSHAWILIYRTWPIGPDSDLRNKPGIKLRVVQFWSEIILVISNWTRAALSFKFEITRMILDQIALHSVQLPLQITPKCIKLALYILCRGTLKHRTNKSKASSSKSYIKIILQTVD